MRGKLLKFCVLSSVLFLLLIPVSEGKAKGLHNTGNLSSRLTLNSNTQNDEIENNIASASVFNTSGLPVDLETLKGSETIKLRGERLKRPAYSFGDLMIRDNSLDGSFSAADKKRIAVSMVSSALLPGLGELYLYLDSGSDDLSLLTRAIGFMALDAYLWYGYKANYDEGKDIKREYEEYGDAHWSVDSFLVYHPWCRDQGEDLCPTWEYYNENAKDSRYYFFYTSKEDDREEYYENMGKYDAFLYGWDDWNGEYEDLGGVPNYWTPHRTHFVYLRDESNKFLQRADNHIMGLIASRVVSVIHAGWVAYREGKNTGNSEGWSLKLENNAVRSRLSLNYRF
ncbi:MAG: hypothetical protein U5O15_03475 [Candidatus Krumholzibacteriota bacterium]|nr:hypothetical protein [Candidatus Krumholzibacteriota bacterium]